MTKQQKISYPHVTLIGNKTLGLPDWKWDVTLGKMDILDQSVKTKIRHHSLFFF